MKRRSEVDDLPDALRAMRGADEPWLESARERLRTRRARAGDVVAGAVLADDAEPHRPS